MIIVGTFNKFSFLYEKNCKHNAFEADFVDSNQPLFRRLNRG